MAGLLQPMMLLGALIAIPALIHLIRTDNDLSRRVAASRILIVVILAFAAAQPWVQTSQSFLSQPQVTVMSDRSNSAELMNFPELEFEDVQRVERVLATGNNSELRRSIVRNIQSDTSYLIKSDFQSTGQSMSGLASEFNSRNSTLNALRKEPDYDASVTISGPDTTVPGADNSYTVTVKSTDDTPSPTASLDGENVDLDRTSNNTWEFTRTFESTSNHTIQASIENGGEYKVNDRYHKAVEVVEKPEILFIGERGSLGEGLSEFYEVRYRNSVPENLERYYAVIATEEVNDESLIPYVTEGNGLIYTGDYSEGTSSVLPVRYDDGTRDTDAAQIVVAIDVSLSSSDISGSVKKSKAVAYNLIERLPYNNQVGVVAYNDEVYRISDSVPLSRNRQMLKNRISRLETGGSSFHNLGIEGPESMLNGTGNIILITDGKTPTVGTIGERVKSDSRKAASELGEITLITVGAGSTRDEELLRELARRGDGQYLDAQDSGRLEFIFSAGGATGQSTQLTVTDPDHYITRGRETETFISDFDDVEKKSGSRLLVTGSDGSPFLTTWRYGIGRVAAYSGDGEQLSRFLRSDPTLVSRTVSWAVGDPKRKQERWIRAENGREPDSVELTANYDPGGFIASGQDTYSREVTPKSLGFHRVNGKLIAYNYPQEYQEVGYSDQLRETVRATGGKVYEMNERDQIAEDIKTFSEQTAVKKTSLSPFLIALALLVFLSEVGYRKVNGKK